LVSYSATVLVQLLVYTQRSNGATASLITHHFTRGSNYKGIGVIKFAEKILNVYFVHSTKPDVLKKVLINIGNINHE
jgi:hypothetical protein